MWIYDQRSGEIRHNGAYVATGYAGRGDGRNNPGMQTVRNVGPLPIGLYRMGAAYNDPKMGPDTIPLTPDPSNEMYGRNGFFEHGNNAANDASEGCPVFDPITRKKQINSPDKVFVVI